MKVPIRIDGIYRDAQIEHVIRSDFDFLAQWQGRLGDDRHPIRTDAVSFAALACKRFTSHSGIEVYAQRVDDISDHITNNPHCEVANLVVMKCDWFTESEVIGVAHFRRSWCNNLILDYLAAHPWIANRPEHFQHKVSGVGTGLLCFLSNIGVRYNCEAIWGEATQNSCQIYKRFFDLESVRDLLYIPRDKYAEFAASLQKKWASK